MKQITVRHADISDMESIHNLVVQLAVYEREESAVITSANDYRNDFLEGRFEALVAIQNNDVVGMALYYPSYSTWKGKMFHLEDFIVNEKMRGLGIGQMIFDRLVEYAKSKDIILLRWHVIDWNELAIKFYKRNNSTITGKWLYCTYYI